MKKNIYITVLLLFFSFYVEAQRQTDASKKLSLATYLISTLYVDDIDEDKLTERCHTQYVGTARSAFYLSRSAGGKRYECFFGREF